MFKEIERFCDKVRSTVREDGRQRAQTLRWMWQKRIPFRRALMNCTKAHAKVTFASFDVWWKTKSGKLYSKKIHIFSKLVFTILYTSLTLTSLYYTYTHTYIAYLATLQVQCAKSEVVSLVNSTNISYNLYIPVICMHIIVMYLFSYTTLTNKNNVY